MIIFQIVGPFPHMIPQVTSFQQLTAECLNSELIH